MIKMTIDYPSLHDDNKLPVLDLKVWVGDNNQMFHEFYMKPMAYQGLIRHDSGLPSRMIKNVIFNEGMRRVSNCSPGLSWDNKVIHLNQFNLFLKRGGHKVGFRKMMTENIVRNYSKILLTHQSGLKPMYRDRQTMKEQKSLKTDKVSWFKDKGFRYKVTVPTTKNNKLGVTMKSELEKISKDNILIQEQSGDRMIDMIRILNQRDQERQKIII